MRTRLGHATSAVLAGVEVDVCGPDVTGSRARSTAEHAPAPVLAHAKPGDMYATMTDVPDGPVTACAIGLPGDLSDPGLQRRVLPHLDKIDVRCAPVEAPDDVVVVEVPPFPRLD